MVKPVFTNTANALLLADATLDAFLLQQYTAGEIQAILKLLEENVYQDLFEQISNYLNRLQTETGSSTPVFTHRLAKAKGGLEMIAQIDTIVKHGYSKTLKTHKKRSVALAKAESQSLVDSWEKRSPVSLGTRRAPLPILRSIVTSRPFEGRLLKEHYGKMSADTRFKVKKALDTGLAQGETIPQMTKRVQTEIGISRRHAETIARTNANHIATQAREATAAANSDVVKGVMISVTLDNRITTICASKDGDIYKIGQGERPPFHPACRTTITYILKSWKEIGINLKEAPPGTRESMSGKEPQTLKYGTWLREQPIATQNHVLGTEIAKLWRARKVTLKDLVDQRNKPLTFKLVEQKRKELRS